MTVLMRKQGTNVMMNGTRQGKETCLELYGIRRVQGSFAV
jgi:hypothetical protein